jgi:hypothetical protein
VCTEFWWGNLRGDHWGDPGVDGRIILGWIFGKWDVGVCACECGDETSGSIKCEKFLD